MTVYLSASSIADFIKCSQKVYYRIKKPFPEEPNKEMIVGKIMHHVLEKAWDNRDVANSLLRQEIGKNPIIKTQDLQNMSFMLDLFFLNFSQLLSADDKVEHTFKLRLFDDVFIVGKMDRVSENGLIDWKTSQRISRNLSNDIQCIIYDYAYEQLFGKKAGFVSIASLREGKLYHYNKNNEYYREVFSNIIPRMIRAIKANQFEKLGIFTHSCFRCSYKNGCLGENNVMDNSDTPD